MNELIIFGIICGAFTVVGLVCGIVESLPSIIAKLQSAWHRACEWLFDVQTAYWKFRAHRERKNKQYLNTRKETNL